MARIAGVDLPRDKRVEIGLTYIYGIGRVSANKILAEAKVNPDTRVRELTDEEVKRIAAIIGDQYRVSISSARWSSARFSGTQWTTQRKPYRPIPSRNGPSISAEGSYTIIWS